MRAALVEMRAGLRLGWGHAPVAMVLAIFLSLLTAVSTYLMAVDSDTVAWVLYGLAGVITLGMVAIPVYFLRELRTLVD